MKNERGTAPCGSCKKTFLKLDLTNRGLCPSYAKANKPLKFG